MPLISNWAVKLRDAFFSVFMFTSYETNSHFATKPYLYVRAAADPVWVVSLNQTNQVTINTQLISILACSGFFSIVKQICIRTRARGYYHMWSTSIACGSSLIQGILLITGAIIFSLEYPFSTYHYLSGGYGAALVAGISCTMAFFFFLADIVYFSSITDDHCVEQKKFEVANFLFVVYVLLGAGIFSRIEGWRFEEAGQFAILTILTIGYGNYVPVTFIGRLIMIIYTIIGLFIAGLYIVSAEEVMLKDSEIPNLRYWEDLVDPDYMDQMGNTNTNLEDDPDAINMTSLPLHRFNTGNSAFSQQTSPSFDDLSFSPHLWQIGKVVLYVIAWWLFSGGVFAYLEGWSYFIGVYFAFVTLTGVGYGDFTLHSPAALEYWWYFLFNAVSIIIFFISFVARVLARKVNRKHVELKRQRLVRRLRNNRISIRAIQGTAYSVDNSFTANSMNSVQRAEMIRILNVTPQANSEVSQNTDMSDNNPQSSITRRFKNVNRVSSAPRLQTIFNPPLKVSTSEISPTIPKDFRQSSQSIPEGSSRTSVSSSVGSNSNSNNNASTGTKRFTSMNRNSSATRLQAIVPVVNQELHFVNSKTP